MMISLTKMKLTSNRMSLLTNNKWIWFWAERTQMRK